MSPLSPEKIKYTACIINPKSCANRTLFWVAITFGKISPKNNNNKVTATILTINSNPGIVICSNTNKSSIKILAIKMIQILIKLLAINMEVNSFLGSSKSFTIRCKGICLFVFNTCMSL